MIGKHGQIASQILKQFKNKKILTLSSKQINFENKNFLNKIRKIKPNIIINAAAFTNVDQAEIEKKGDASKWIRNKRIIEFLQK